MVSVARRRTLGFLQTKDHNMRRCQGSNYLKPGGINFHLTKSEVGRPN